MIEFTQKYINEVNELFRTKRAREHAYRPALHTLLNSLKQSSDIKVLNDPKRSEYGAPDFIIIKKELPVGYIETKDLGADLDKTETSKQLERYYGYTNLILTDYLEFRFFINGEKTEMITVGKLVGNKIETYPDELENLAGALKDFIFSPPASIRSGLQLAKIMGGKARRIRDNVRHFLNQESEQNQELERIYNAIKKLLIHDLTKEAFADMYAQTLVYGLFVARYHDETAESFTRQEARDLIPKSNPLLRHFFDHIVGPDFDKRLEYIVNELCEVFSHADVHELMAQYFKKDLWGKAHEGPDPVIHFYEDFLKEYNPELRKKLGAFYTPLPIVRFIVRSVDKILEKEFSLTSGLANTSKLDNGKHKVQILDPATGTGTFISAIIRSIYERLLRAGQKGRWPAYVHRDLLPRLHGFELMMAPYTIAHLKLSMAFKETGFKYFNQRLGIYLTNSLEQNPLQQDLFTGFGLAESIAEESKEAAIIKNKMPIMVVIGNPPYSGVSSNETKYANNLVGKYKVEPGGKQKLNERKHWLNDDYVKFIAFAEHMVEKNKEGIVGFITNHSYLDNPTFRGMRWHLMDTFDSLYIIDLHGNSKKQETPPDNIKDENVFDIQQGVSILLAVKTGKKEAGQLAKVYRTDVWGKRESKFTQLDDLSIENAKWVLIECRLPNLVFAQEGSREFEAKYRLGFDVNSLFIEKATGIVTARDGLVISEDKEELRNRIRQFSDDNLSDLDIRQRFFPGKSDGKYKAGDSRGWKLSESRKIIRELNQDDQIKLITYRPLDTRFIYYHPKMVDWGREKTVKHLLSIDNLGLIFTRQAIGGSYYSHIMISKYMSDNRVFFSNKGIPIEAPLYIYNGDGSKFPNLKKEIVDQIEKTVGKVRPEDVLDYIYAVLHSPIYREKYKEFLKTDFPRVPYPKDAEQFKKLVAKGKELRELHLMESPLLNKLITTYPKGGSDKVEKVEFCEGRVYINGNQFFGNVPEVAWGFYIGGYQPAQKWLKDRKGRILTNEDIEHYQKIVKALAETDRIMKEIDEIKIIEESI